MQSAFFSTPNVVCSKSLNRRNNENNETEKIGANDSRSVTLSFIISALEIRFRREEKKGTGCLCKCDQIKKSQSPSAVNFIIINAYSPWMLRPSGHGSQPCDTKICPFYLGIFGNQTTHIYLRHSYISNSVSFSSN